MFVCLFCELVMDSVFLYHKHLKEDHGDVYDSSIVEGVYDEKEFEEFIKVSEVSRFGVSSNGNHHYICSYNPDNESFNQERYEKSENRNVSKILPRRYCPCFVKSEKVSFKMSL